MEKEEGNMARRKAKAWKKDKEDAVKSLHGEQKIKCKKCGGTTFYRKMIEISKVEVINDGETTRDEDLGEVDCQYEYTCTNCEEVHEGLG